MSYVVATLLLLLLLLQVEEQLRERIDQLEKRQTQDDAVINVINRYWNQLNEDIRILLQVLVQFLL